MTATIAHYSKTFDYLIAGLISYAPNMLARGVKGLKVHPLRS